MYGNAYRQPAYSELIALVHNFRSSLLSHPLCPLSLPFSDPPSLFLCVRIANCNSRIAAVRCQPPIAFRSRCNLLRRSDFPQTIQPTTRYRFPHPRRGSLFSLISPSDFFLSFPSHFHHGFSRSPGTKEPTGPIRLSSEKSANKLSLPCYRVTRLEGRNLWVL